MGVLPDHQKGLYRPFQGQLAGVGRAKVNLSDFRTVVKFSQRESVSRPSLQPPTGVS